MSVQPVCVFRCAVAGLVYLNGRMAGEVGDGQTLCAPVSPTGALYVEMRPFCPSALPLSCRLVFSAGAPIPSCMNDARAQAVLWPGGTVDIDIVPQWVAQEGDDFLEETDQQSAAWDAPAEQAETSAEQAWDTQSAEWEALEIAESVRAGDDCSLIADGDTVQALRTADAVVPMQYPLTGGGLAVGLVYAVTPQYARVRALRYTTVDGRVERLWV